MRNLIGRRCDIEYTHGAAAFGVRALGVHTHHICLQKGDQFVWVALTTIKQIGPSYEPSYRPSFWARVWNR